jgi:hypothetical protein
VNGFRLGILTAAAFLPVHFDAAAEPYTAAEALFQSDPRWIGGDAALSIPLGGERVLWLFGDSFVGRTAGATRKQSDMVRNSVAVQTGKDPRAARMQFFWGRATDGGPASFFPDEDSDWFWPGHGCLLPEGPLVVFLTRVTSDPGNALGFRVRGSALVVVENPADPPSAWTMRRVAVPADFPALPAPAVLLEGSEIIALALKPAPNGHPGTLVRFPTADLARGDLTTARWWSGPEQGWVPTASLGPDGPAVVLDDAGPECSLHGNGKTYVHIASQGFGATTIACRTSPALTGPWSAPQILDTPPESRAARPFVYAAKAHPELPGLAPDHLVITYVANSLDPEGLFAPGGETLYWPRVLSLRLPPGTGR